MTAPELKYVQRYRDRHGKMRCYFRRAGYARIALPDDPTTERFKAAYQAALTGLPKPSVSRAVPGSISAVLIAYYRSSGWSQLKPQTQATYRAVLDRFREKFGELPANALTSTHVRKLIDAGAAKPGATRTLMKRLSSAFAFATMSGLVGHNPFSGVKLPREGAGFRAWSDDDIQQFLDHWPAGSRARLALLLLLHTGQRRSDVVRMGRQHLRNGVLAVTQSKGRAGEPRVILEIPLHPEFVRQLEALPKTDATFLTTAYGKPITANGFTNWFSNCAAEAGLPRGCSAHGLRKAAARRLAEAGCSAHQIAAITGHKSLKEVERYTQSVRQKRLARDAMARLWSGDGADRC